MLAVMYRLFAPLNVDDILLLVPTVTGLQHLLTVCERELVELNMHVKVNKSMCIRFGQRSNVQCADLSSIHGDSLKWVNSCRYLGVHFVNRRTLKCSFDSAKSKFYRAFNAVYSKVGTAASEETVLALLRAKCLTITRSHGNMTSVVRATRQVNGRRQTYPSHHTHTP